MLGGSAAGQAGRWYLLCFNKAKEGLGMSGAEISSRANLSAETVHGALLTTAELLGPAGPELDLEQISQLFDLAWRHRDHRDRTVSACRAVLALLTMALLAMALLTMAMAGPASRARPRADHGAPLRREPCARRDTCV